MKNLYLRLTCLVLSSILALLCCACGNATTGSDVSSNITSDSSVVSTVTVTDATRPNYKPYSLTLSIYDTSTNSYGFTWNTTNEPVDPVIQICEGTSFDESNCTEVKATIDSGNTKITKSQSAKYYISKANLSLKAGTKYTYRAYDKGAEIGSDTATFKTNDFTAKSFRFVNITDSQALGPQNNVDNSNAEGTGVYLNNVYKSLTRTGTPDFVLHTGDMVHYPKYKNCWTNMIDYNSKYYTSIPTMAISGNHESESAFAGNEETYNHFNYNIPEQDVTKGFYYSFIYGDVKFIMLNTGERDGKALETAQYNWLVNELENKTTKWVIVSLHIPVYSAGEYGLKESKNATTLALQEQLTRLFGDYKVDLVLQGHEHIISKTYPIKSDGTAVKNTKTETHNSTTYAVNPNGVIYAIHGTTGSLERKPYETVDKNIFEYTSSSHSGTWADMTVEGDRLTVKVMYYDDATGINTRYSYGIIKK